MEYLVWYRHQGFTSQIPIYNIYDDYSIAYRTKFFKLITFIMSENQLLVVPEIPWIYHEISRFPKATS